MTTDPAEELFDLVTENGEPRGEVKRRPDVHRDGDWHRAFHLWLFTRDHDGVDRVLFQRRSSGKDTWPDRLDVAVGGHFRAGETIDDVVREIEEEIGIHPELSHLTYAGRRRAVSIRPGLRDRELQEIYLLAFDGGFPEFAPDGIELAALVSIAIDDVLRLFREQSTSVPAAVAPVVADRQLGEWRSTPIFRDDFVPVSDNYWVRGGLMGRALLSGDRKLSLDDV